LLSVQYNNTEKHELVILNPVESIPVNIFLMLASNSMNEEIIFSNSVPFILEENFWRVV